MKTVVLWYIVDDPSLITIVMVGIRKQLIDDYSHLELKLIITYKLTLINKIIIL